MEAFDNAKVDPQRLKKLNERIGPPEVSFFCIFFNFSGSESGDRFLKLSLKW